MNPYHQLEMHLAGAAPAPTAPGTLTNYTPDVAQNIGHDKLAKKPYNPYGLINPNMVQGPKAPASKEEKFTQEMLKDSRE